MPLLVAVLISLIPFWAWVARRNPHVSEVLVSGEFFEDFETWIFLILFFQKFFIFLDLNSLIGWVPVIASMVISSGGGFILDFALAGNPGVAVYSPVINGVGGNLVAVFSSRISTFLHLNHEKTQLPTEFGTGCVRPCFLLCSSGPFFPFLKILNNFFQTSKKLKMLKFFKKTQSVEVLKK